MLRELCHEEKGYSLVTVALLLMILTILLALVCDIGYAYVQRWQMQNAADAGALAGTRALFLGQDAQQAAANYAQRNGAKNVAVTVDPGQQTVRVEAKTDFPTFVASILGIDTFAADNPAKAIHGAVVEMAEGGVYPIAVKAQEFDLTGKTLYDMYVGVEPGNFGWLSWNGTMSEGYLCASLAYPGESSVDYINPYDSGDYTLSVENWVWGRPGIANSSCVRDQLDYFKNNEDAPMTIVVWDATQFSGSDAQYRIKGFAKFILTDYCLPGQNRISGKFIEWVEATTLITLDPNADFGVHGVKLTE
jgi:hypothetical protein